MKEVPDRPSPHNTEQRILERGERERIRDATWKFVDEVARQKPDMMIFLDRSMRPLYYAFDAAWNKLFPGAQHPPVVHLNIGREKRFMKSMSGASWRTLPHDVKLEMSRMLGQKQPSQSPRILIVDDFSDSGGSLHNASSIMAKEFPAADIRLYTYLDFCPPWSNNEALTGLDDDPENPIIATPVHLKTAHALADEMQNIFETN